MIIIEVEVPPYKNGQFSIWCPDYWILWRGSQQTLRLLSTWIPVGDFVQKVLFSNVLAEPNATFPLSQFARLFPTGFPKSSLLDNDFVLLDVERKGAIDFRSLILACRLSTKNKFTPIFVQTCNPFQLYMKNNISWSPQTIKKLMSIRLVFAKNREERMRWAFKV